MPDRQSANKFLTYTLPDLSASGGLEQQFKLRDVRLFAIDIDGRYIHELDDQQSRFFEHIFTHQDHYDVSFCISKNGIILSRIGDISTDHSKESSFFWITFIAINLIIKFYSSFLFDGNPSFLFYIVIYLCIGVGLAGVVHSTFFKKTYFHKHLFGQHYLLILLILIVVEFIVLYESY